MPRFCSSCGTQMDDSATFCAKCGTAVGQPGGVVAAAPAPAAAATTTAGGLTDNIAGMLAYVTFIPAIIFLVLEPYNKNRFIRFHSFQCIFICIALIAIHIVLAFVPIIGWIVSVLVSLGAFILWIVLLIKAYQGQMFKVPFVGDMAEKQANA